MIKDFIIGQKMWSFFQLDQPGRLQHIRLANVEEQDDGSRGSKIPITEHLITTKTNRKRLEDNVTIKKTSISF